MSGTDAKIVNDVKSPIKTDAAKSAADATHKSLSDYKAHPHKFSLIADGVVLVFALTECLLYYTAYDNCYWYVWYGMAIALVAKGAAAAFAANIHTDPASAPLKLISSTDGLYFALGLAIVALFPSPTIFITLAVIAHTLVDLISAQRPAFRQIAPAMEGKAGGALDSIPPHIIDVLRFAGGCLEMLAFFVLPFCGSFLLWTVFVAFLLLRYRSDRQVRHVWTSLSGVAEKGVKHPAVPPAVGQNYTKAKDALYKTVTSF